MSHVLKRPRCLVRFLLLLLAVLAPGCKKERPPSAVAGGRSSVATLGQASTVRAGEWDETFTLTQVGPLRLDTKPDLATLAQLFPGATLKVGAEPDEQGRPQSLIEVLRDGAPYLTVMHANGKLTEVRVRTNRHQLAGGIRVGLAWDELWRKMGIFIRDPRKDEQVEDAARVGKGVFKDKLQASFEGLSLEFVLPVPQAWPAGEVRPGADLLELARWDKKKQRLLAPQRIEMIRWFPRVRDLGPEHPQSAAACKVPTCVAPEQPVKTLADQAFKDLHEDPLRASCLAARASALAEKAGDHRLAGAALYTLGRAHHSLDCPWEAWRAFRRALCLRPRGSTSARVFRLTRDACQRASGNLVGYREDCADPCGPLSGAPPPEESGAALPWRVSRGSLVRDTSLASLFRQEPCEEKYRKVFRLEEAEIEAVACRDESARIGLAILKRLPQGAGYKVLSRLELSSEGYQGNDNGTFSDEEAADGQSAQIRLDVESSFGYARTCEEDDEGTADCRAAHVRRSTTIVRFNANLAWLDREEESEEDE